MLWLDELQCVGKQEDGKMHVCAVGLVCLLGQIYLPPHHPLHAVKHARLLTRVP